MLRMLPVLALSCGLTAAACHPPASGSTWRDDFGYTIGHDGDRLHASGRGTVALTDDGRDIASLGAEGALTITQGTWLHRMFIGSSRRIEIRHRADGTLEREFFIAGEEWPWDPEGAAWMSEALPRLLDGGFASRARVEQLMRTGGAPAVLAAVPALRSDYLQARFLTHLLDEGNGPPESLGPLLAVAAREIAADYEMARLLHRVADGVLDDADARPLFFEAAATISSDHELQGVLAELVERSDLSADALDAALRTSVSLSADHEMSRLLQAVAGRHGVEAVRESFFAAAATISADHEHARVLRTVIENGEAGDETLAALLRSASGIGSDHELSRVLVQLAAGRPLSGPVHEQYMAAVQTLGSDSERNRALAALLERPAGAQSSRLP